MILIFVSISFFACEQQKAERQARQRKEPGYAVAVLATPVLNTPDFASVFGGKDGKTLKLNKRDQIAEVEFIAMPQTVFTIEETIKKDSYEILKITTDDYPYQNKKGYYIDSRFVEKKIEKPEDRKKILPDKKEIISRLLSAKGAAYVWGGNFMHGIPEMLEFYKPSGMLSEDTKRRWILRGVDCSGLLYEATNGYMPRNTEALFDFGRHVDIKGIRPDEIAGKLEPLDIVVYQRHVIIVLNNEQVIESVMKHGVHIRELVDVLKEVGKKMQPAHDHKIEGVKGKFFVRRWYP